MNAEERIMTVDLRWLEAWCLPLLVGLVCLMFLDVLSTLAALRNALFLEMNPLVARLFQMQYGGFLLALVLKYLPLFPIAFIVGMHDKAGYADQMRVLKVSVFIALIGADVFYSTITVSNTVQLISVLTAR